MPSEFASIVTGLPSVPERAVRSTEDSIRNSDETERRRLLRASYQSTGTVKSNPIAERRSEEAEEEAEGPLRNPPTPYQHAPSTSFTESPHEMSRLPPDHRPLGPGNYARSTSNDYTVYGDPPTPSQSNAVDVYSNGAVAAGTDSFGRPYRRAGPASMRDPAEAGSVNGGRYTPLVSGQTPKKPIYYPQNQPGFPDRYQMGPTDNDPEVTPPRPGLKKRGTSLYLVREGAGTGNGGSPPPDEILRLPFTFWMQDAVKNHFVAFMGEFVGTTMFLFFAFAGTLVANIGARESKDNTTTAASVGFSPIVNLYVAFSFGFSLMVNVWIFFRVSGGLFNPAVTLGMVMTKTIGYVRAFLLLVAQLVGAIFASFLVQILLPYDFNVRTTLSASTSVARGVFIELILTAELVFTIFMLAKEKHKATHLAPIGIGIALFIAELVGVFFTGG